MNLLILLLDFNFIVQNQIYLFSTQAIDKVRCDIEVHLESDKKTFKVKDSKAVYLILTNNSKVPVKVPDDLFIGGSLLQEDVEVVFDIEMFVPRKHKFLSLDQIERDSSYAQDYQLICYERNYTTIAPGKSNKYKLGIELVNSLIFKGLYRIRANLQLQSVNNGKIVKTNWIKLKVVE
ncbi:MAG TPA: hypothetical protein DEO60_10755 [Bacteroidales bacterium]|jgi:hypothetical protein|nr:hypothetical protein [Bacteroidales bacterium]HBZ21602.1 hypothetical protein [Bacteroidales bacterium]